IGSIEIEKKNQNKYQNNQHITEEQKEDHHIKLFHFTLLKAFDKCNGPVRNFDYVAFDNDQLLCFGSENNTVCLWNIKTNEQIQSFNGHSDYVNCVRFSPYHHYNDNNSHRNVICSSSADKTIRFWDIKDCKQFQVFDGHTSDVECIEFSSFNNGRYLCSGSTDKTIRLWDIETSKSLHVFNGHMNNLSCVDFSPLQSNNDINNKSNSIGIIGGNGYTICSGSYDNTIRIWDIESLKDVIVFKGHEDSILCVKYLPYESRISGGANIILSGSADQSVRLWDIRSNQQIQMFDEHTSVVSAVEYLSFGSNRDIICSGSFDNTIRFWDVRFNKQLDIIKKNKGDCGIICLKYLPLNDENSIHENTASNNDYYFNLCCGSFCGRIRIWG
ncbi:hypothetical protein RFI_36367, partial [Reticulomyxa filosa]